MVVQPHQPFDRGVGLLLEQIQRRLVALQRRIVLADQRVDHAEAFVQLHRLRTENREPRTFRASRFLVDPSGARSRFYLVRYLKRALVQRDRLTVGVAGLGLAAGAQVIVEGRLHSSASR